MNSHRSFVETLRVAVKGPDRYNVWPGALSNKKRVHNLCTLFIAEVNFSTFENNLYHSFPNTKVSIHVENKKVTK